MAICDEFRRICDQSYSLIKIKHSNRVHFFKQPELLPNRSVNLELLTEFGVLNDDNQYCKHFND